MNLYKILLAVLALLVFASSATATTYHCPDGYVVRGMQSEEIENLTLTIPHNALWRSFKSRADRAHTNHQAFANLYHQACTFAEGIAESAAPLPARSGSAYPSYFNKSFLTNQGRYRCVILKPEEIEETEGIPTPAEELASRDYELNCYVGGKNSNDVSFATPQGN